MLRYGSAALLTVKMLTLSLLTLTGCASSGNSSASKVQDVTRPELDLNSPPAELRRRAALEWSSAQHIAPAADRGVSGQISEDARRAYLRAGRYYMAASSGEREPQQSAEDSLAAAHAYIRGGRPVEALPVIMSVANDVGVNAPLRAEALYRAHQAHAAAGDNLNAELALKRLRFDYPTSRWAQMHTR